MTRCKILFSLFMVSLCAHAQIRVPLPDIPLKDQDFTLPYNKTNVVHNDVVYFPWDDGVHGEELWRSDGTVEGTYMLADLNPIEYGYLSGLTYSNNEISFTLSGDGNSSGLKSLYRSDGTVSGTRLVYQSHTRYLTGYAFGQWTYFTRDGRIYRTRDGLQEPEEVASYNKLIATPTRLYWENYSDAHFGTDGNSVWVTNWESFPVQALGETLVFDEGHIAIADGPFGNSYRILNSGMQLKANSMVEINGTFFFLAGVNYNNYALWSSEGTAETTQILSHGYPWGIRPLDTTLMAAPNGVAFLQNQELYFSDGSPEGSRLIHSFDHDAAFDRYFGSNDSDLFFYLSHNDNGRYYKAYQTNGTDLVPLDVSSIERAFQPISNGLLLGTESRNLRLVSETRNTDIETVKTRQGLSRVSTNSGTFIGSLGNGIWFIPSHGSAIQISDAYSGELSSTGTHAYFRANGKIWESDGTPNGTIDLGLTGRFRTFANQFVAFNDGTLHLRGIYNQDVPDMANFRQGEFFFHDHRVFGYNRYDFNINIYEIGGSVTRRDLERSMTEHLHILRYAALAANGATFNFLNYRSDSSSAGDIRIVRDEVSHYAINDSYSGNGLFADDGRRVRAIYDDHHTAPDIVNSIDLLGNTYYFAGETEELGVELYRVTAVNPVLVADVLPGSASAEVDNITPHNGKIYFTARSADHRTELWRHDPATDETRRVLDPNTGKPFLHPRNFISDQFNLFFEALEEGPYKLVQLRSLRSDMTSPTSLCGTNTGTATAHENVAGAEYSWSITGGTLASGQNSRQVTFNANANADQVTLSLTVTYNDESQTSSRIMPVTQAAPARPTSISGPTSVCPERTDVYFSASAVANAEDYEWELPPGAYFQEGANGRVVQIGFADQGGTVRVRARNACGASEWFELQVAMSSETIAYAGPDQVSCETSLTLEGNASNTATGEWTILEGSGGSFSDPSLHNATFTGSPGQTYLLEWSLNSTSCGQSTDTVRIHMERDVPTAQAGNDLNICGLSTSLSANPPGSAVGVWHVSAGAGGTFADPYDHQTTFTGLAGETYTLTWSLYAKPCGDSSDSLQVTFLNSLDADAGPDQNIAHNSAAQLCASGLGSWTVISGPSLSPNQFDDPQDPFTTFRPFGGVGDYQLQWDLAETGCGRNSDTSFIHALDTVPEATLVGTYGTTAEDEISPPTIDSSLRLGDAYYYLANGQTQSLCKVENGVTSNLANVSISLGTNTKLHPFGENILVTGSYGAMVYKTQKNRLTFLHRFGEMHYDPEHITVAYNNRLYFRKQYETDFYETDGATGITRKILDKGNAFGIWQDQFIFFTEGQVFAMAGNLSDAYSLTPGESYKNGRMVGTTDTHLFFSERFDYRTSNLHAINRNGSSKQLLTVGDDTVYKAVGKIGQTLLFTMAENSQATPQLWRSDGTLEGTFSLGVSTAKDSPFFVKDHHLYFASDGESWYSDGTLLGTQMFWSEPLLGAGVLNDQVYISTKEGLYHYDGVNVQATAVRGYTNIQDFNPPEHLYISDKGFMYKTDNPDTLGEMIHPGRKDYDSLSPHMLRRRASFLNGRAHVMGTDGTDAGTQDLPPNGARGSIRQSRGNGTHALYQTFDDTTYRLYATNGTPEGTQLLSTAARSENFLFETHPDGFLVGHEETGLYFYDGKGETRLYGGDVKGPFKDPYTDDYIYITSQREVRRTNGTVEDQETLLTINALGQLSGHHVQFTENHIFINYRYDVFIVDRSDYSYQTYTLPFTSYFRQSRLTTLGESLVFHHGTPRRMDSNGEIHTYDLPNAYYYRMIHFEDKLAISTRDHIHLLSETEVLASHELDVDAAPFLYNMGSGILFSTFKPHTGTELVYFDQNGARPLAEMVEGPDDRSIKGIVAGDDLAYVFTEDPNARTAVYKVAFFGPVFTDPNLKAHILRLYDANKDGAIDWDEAALITELDLRIPTISKRGAQGLGIRSLSGIEGLINLSRIYIGGNPIRNLNPIVEAGLGEHPDDIIDIQNTLIGDDACGDLATLLSRTNSSGAEMTYEVQGGFIIDDVKPEEWPQKNVIELISESIAPVYELQCAGSLISVTGNVINAEVQ